MGTTNALNYVAESMEEMNNQMKTPYRDVPSMNAGLSQVSGVPSGLMNEAVEDERDEQMTAAGIDSLTPVDKMLEMNGDSAFITAV